MSVVHEFLRKFMCMCGSRCTPLLCIYVICKRHFMYGEQQTTLFKHLSIKGILKRIDRVIRKTKVHVQFIYITAKVDIIRTSVYFLKIFLIQMKKNSKTNFGRVDHFSAKLNIFRRSRKNQYFAVENPGYYLVQKQTSCAKR